MPTRKPTVIVTRRLPDVVETRMRELFSTTLNETDAPMSQSDLVEAVKTGRSPGAYRDRQNRQVCHHAGWRSIEADCKLRHRR